MSAAPRAHILAAGQTHPGLKRANNEDRYAIVNGQFGAQPMTLAILADGIGGHQAGEVAAEIAVQTIREVVTAAKEGEPREILTRAYILANQRINQAAQQQEKQRGMGTTCVTAWVIGERLYTVSLGDSRIYLWRNNQLQQITTDHTWVQEAIEAGVLTPQEARHHPNARIVRRYLGAPQNEVPDFRQRLNGVRSDEITGLRLQPGDFILLCSDGLSDLVEDADIAAILQENRAPEQTLERLIQRANDKGGRDNITAILLEVSAEPEDKVRQDMLLVAALAMLMLCLGSMLALLVGGTTYLLLH